MNITGANQFTPSVYRVANEAWDIIVSGTFTATVVVQLSKDNVTWQDVDTATSATVKTAKLGTAWYIRAGVKTGAYTSGTVSVDIY